MMKVDKLPVRTWEWLLVNEADLRDEVSSETHEYTEKLPVEIEDIGLHNIEKTYSEYRTGLGNELDEVIQDSGLKVHNYRVKEGLKVNTPAYQDFEVSGNTDRASLLFFDVEANASCTVIQFITAKDGSEEPSHFLLQNKYHVGKNGKLTLVQVQNLGSECEFVNDCGGECDDNANFHRIQLILGGGKTYSGEFCELGGRKSSFKCDIGYKLTGSHRLDMNYVANHDGQNSESDIHVSGVMADTSYKLFRGTIDFHKGCAGAKGAELEEVLLMDDTIVNKTVPLILCDEEDVEGSHGATIGQLDENLIFYMESRGIKEDEIYALMAQAKIDAVAGLIEDESTKERISRL